MKKNSICTLGILAGITIIAAATQLTYALPFDIPVYSEKGMFIEEAAADALNAQNLPWNLYLVNRDNFMDLDYEPVLKSIGSGHYFDERAADYLTQMLSDAEKEGLSPVICSSYRTVEKQTTLFHNKIQRLQNAGLNYDDAYEQARRVVAYPGTSEHSLGLAVDIVSAGNQSLTSRQANTAEAKWLMANCHKYGFILRYPNDKQDITNIIYEPWHYRYVGVEAATEIYESGVCLEEYLAQYDTK